VSDEAHALEHSLEVHLPFLQTVLADFTLVPLAVGHASAEEVAEVLEALWGGPETLIVVSSDLSHYLPYRSAQSVDRDTADAVLALATDIDHDHACGATPVSGLALAARQHNLTPELLDLRNSGDTAGDKSRVVGYASFAFYDRNPA
jgi:AmmeMemoRadiSam system protein B